MKVFGGLAVMTSVLYGVQSDGIRRYYYWHQSNPSIERRITPEDTKLADQRAIYAFALSRVQSI